jgi:hypothetical protein
MAIEIIHHYTDIETLALILKNRTIRFNRLDHVDDITEGEAFSTLRLEKFLFISCWTYNHEESLPQWNMYTNDMAGVRISLPIRMFDYQSIKIPSKYKDAVQRGTIISPIPFEKIHADNYFIPPMFLDENYFARKVSYVSDFVKRKNDAIKIQTGPNGKFDIDMKDPIGIAALKSPAWKFQKEYRFVLLIFPSIPYSEVPKFFEKQANFIANNLYQGKGSELNYFDVSISQSVLDEIEITTGPLCQEGGYLIVKALLEKYTSSTSIRKSKFEGTIRKSKGK